MASDTGAADRDRGPRRRGGHPAPGGGAGRAGDPVVRFLLGLTGVFAVVAAVVVVVSEDGRLLRLGVVAGLWATLLAVAALARRSASGGAQEVAALEETLRRTYELELAAEVDARREHELTVERSVRREVAAEAGEEIAGLRAEVERLRTHLEQAEAHAVRPALRVVAGGAHPSPRSGPPPSGPPRPVTPPPPSRAETDGRTVAELLAAYPPEGHRRRL